MRASILLTTVLLAPAVQASDPVLTAECETALARSALPQRLRSEARVVGLTDSGYRELAPGAGPFTCIVERNHPDALIPQCVDAAGAETLIPALVWKSEQALAGRDPSVIQAEFRTKSDRGQFLPPPRPGLSYMVSAYNYIFIPERGEIVKVHPHLMFYAPGLTNEDVGGSFQEARENRGLPFILDSGIHGYMITFVDQPAAAEEVALACAGELDESRISAN